MYSMKSFSLALIRDQKEKAPTIGDFLDAFWLFRRICWLEIDNKDRSLD
jgi:hypothetical protein